MALGELEWVRGGKKIDNKCSTGKSNQAVALYQELWRKLDAAKILEESCLSECNGSCDNVTCKWCPIGEDLSEARDKIRQYNKDIADIILYWSHIDL